jgi:hypothetical protein
VTSAAAVGDEAARQRGQREGWRERERERGEGKERGRQERTPPPRALVQTGRPKGQARSGSVRWGGSAVAAWTRVATGSSTPARRAHVWFGVWGASAHRMVGRGMTQTVECLSTSTLRDVVSLERLSQRASACERVSAALAGQPAWSSVWCVSERQRERQPSHDPRRGSGARQALRRLVGYVRGLLMFSRVRELDSGGGEGRRRAACGAPLVCVECSGVSSTPARSSLPVSRARVLSCPAFVFGKHNDYTVADRPGVARRRARRG